MIMKILLIHQNFPGQFLHLGPALVRDGHEVHALVMKKEVPAQWQGVVMHSYMPTKGTAQGVHPWVLDMETKVIRGEAVFRKGMELKAAGFEPDVVVAHPGWGESLFIKDVWPETRLGLYCEFNYNEHGQDVGFDPEFSVDDAGDACRLRLKNLNNMMHFELADGAVSPTHFQADTYPYPFRTKIKVLHDGIDTKVIVPNEPKAVALFACSTPALRLAPPVYVLALLKVSVPEPSLVTLIAPAMTCVMSKFPDPVNLTLPLNSEL